MKESFEPEPKNSQRLNTRKKVKKNLRIAIIGAHEMIGLEECALEFKHRKMSIKCYS